MSRILRIRTSSPGANPDNFVLVRVDQAQDVDVLNLTIVASEGSSSYATHLGDDDLARLRARNHKGDMEEWRAVFKWCLLRQRPALKFAGLIEHVEMVADVKPQSSLTVGLRNNISGITQRLGSIELAYDESLEIQLFDWTGVAAATTDRMQADNETLQEKLEAKDNDLNNLKALLDELTVSKKAHEAELLEKCRYLLNSKKSKIRDQQRLLAISKVDVSVGQGISHARGGSVRDTGPKSKGTKRKKAAAVDEQDDSDDGFEAPINVKKEISNSGGDTGVTTPEPSEPSSETDSDDGGARDQTESPPPPRELPFRHEAGPIDKRPAATHEAVDNGDDEETDDEL